MNKIKVKNIILLLVVQMVLIVSDVKSFGPITHYHINKEIQNLGDLFNSYGMMPDAITLLRKWVDPAHSPVPLPDWSTKPSFAFILARISQDPNHLQSSLGWGGHISTDWIAHHPNFLPIVPIFDILGTAKHFGIETTIDLYMFLSRGAVIPTHRFYGKHLWRGFVNWQMIDYHEERGEFPTTPNQDKEDRDIAIADVNSDIPPFIITSTLAWWSGVVISEQVGFIVLTMRTPLPAIEAFKLAMSALYENKITEAKGAVDYWLNTIAPCNTQGCARGIPSQYFSSPSLKPRIALNPKTKLSNNLTEEMNSKELIYKFWNDVAEACKNAGVLVINQIEGIDEYGNSYTEVTPQITDEERYYQILQQVINIYITNPETPAHLHLGKWLKRVFIEGNLNVNLILDFEPPNIEILSPPDQDYVNANPIIISGKAVDKNFLSYKLEYGIGDNPPNFNLICEGTNSVEDGTLCSWNTTNLSGLYTLKLSAIDKNDNENEIRIKVYVGNPVLISSFGKKGKANGEFNQPSFIATDSSGNTYITDTMNHRVQKFDKNNNFLLSFGEKSKGAPSERLGEFNKPMGVAIDSQDNIYIADSLNHRIQKFNSNGNYISSFGKKGQANGEFNQPVGIAINSEGNIFVSDSMNHRVQKFNAQGNFLMQFGTKGNNAGQFNQPMGVAIDSKNNIHIADSMNNRIQVFDKSGNFVKIIIDNLKQPEGIFTDTKDNIYISDTMNGRILKLDRYGNKIFEFGQKEEDNSQFNQPVGILVSQDKIFVVDSLNHRIQVFGIKYGTISSPKKIDSNLQNENIDASPSAQIENVYVFPNPYRGTTPEARAKGQSGITFKYKTEGNIQKVMIEVYNLAGRLVDKFEDTTIDGEINWGFADKLSNGVYVYRITISDGVNKVGKTGKLVILK